MLRSRAVRAVQHGCRSIPGIPAGPRAAAECRSLRRGSSKAGSVAGTLRPASSADGGAAARGDPSGWSAATAPNRRRPRVLVISAAIVLSTPLLAGLGIWVILNLPGVFGWLLGGALLAGAFALRPQLGTAPVAIPRSGNEACMRFPTRSPGRSACDLPTESSSTGPRCLCRHSRVASQASLDSSDCRSWRSSSRRNA